MIEYFYRTDINNPNGYIKYVDVMMEIKLNCTFLPLHDCLRDECICFNGDLCVHKAVIAKVSSFSWYF